ncbi:hypothetical protein ONZ51_g12095 [Trametes cubensis]|uniref:CCHC-type domain-containing protein n=1 Tax=Trametes cubensis TaxID=1111947 RepID=A0AAD7TH78_9APHY|nr:hypothetical protein ONZ51_g12095 [Trametes cubensis]
MEGDNINYWKGIHNSAVFKRNFLLAFAPVDKVDDSMVNLMTIKLKDYSSVNEFNARFMDLALKGKILDPAAQLALYKNALPEYLLKKISMLYPPLMSIREWMTRTKEVDHSYHLTEKILANSRGCKAKTSKTRKNVKMVNVEDDSLDTNKLSVKERQELQDKGSCFRCRKPGHISRDCPSKPKKPSKPVSWKVQQVTDKDLEDESEEISDEEDDKDKEDNISINTLRATDFETVTIVTNTERRRSALLIPGYMQVQNKAVETKGLIDTGADTVIVNKKIVDKYNLPTVRLPKTLTFQNANNSVNSMGTITHRVEGTFNLHGKKLPTNWYVADIGQDDVLFGMPWIRKYNPNINWESAAMKDQKEKTLDEILPDFVKDYRQVFEKKAASRFPPSRPWDHAIEFKKDFDHHTKGSWRKIYPLTYTERIELNKFIAENLEKGYIQKSKSPLASPFFFVTKKDGSLQPVQDYRALNEGTIKNAYPLLLISDIIDWLKGATIYTKLDVQAGYNNVRIKEGDEWKAAFITPSRLFEPTVMFFGLCNALATFQNMMNDLF